MGVTNYDELLNFVIVLTLYAINGFARDAFSARSLCSRVSTVPESCTTPSVASTPSLYGRDEIVRQQLGFDFTGRGRIAGITFTEPFFIVANVKFVG
ncbi:hypothetical protein KCP78_23850 [Salmonella enterica subsp. enterica]|nr:hypothetical protein KCP78_23850 [Salmonella enterica subsp. enterica]